MDKLSPFKRIEKIGYNPRKGGNCPLVFPGIIRRACRSNSASKVQEVFSSRRCFITIIQLSLRAELITVVSEADGCRDQKDNFLLALAEDGRATHSITGDNDLLVLDKYRQTKILTVEVYLQSL